MNPVAAVGGKTGTERQVALTAWKTASAGIVEDTMDS
jgi:hypothetical protein